LNDRRRPSLEFSPSRRGFLINAALAGAGGFGALGLSRLGNTGRALAAEPPPEITTIRFEKDPVICIPPQVADELLRAEGFTDIRYVELTEAHVRRADAANVSAIDDMIASGDVDFARDFVPSHIASLNAGTSQPAQIAQLLVDNGYTTRFDYALQALSEIR
jgi:NitT/TauT family transport system substrate-binding protein